MKLQSLNCRKGWIRMHSKDFEKYKKRYERGGCTIAQLHRLTELGKLTPEEFEEITGEVYEP